MKSNSDGSRRAAFIAILGLVIRGGLRRREGMRAKGPDAAPPRESDRSGRPSPCLPGKRLELDSGIENFHGVPGSCRREIQMRLIKVA